MTADGFFLVLEGGEGSGKSTVARLLAQRFEGPRRPLVTREPGGSAAAEAIRAVILSDGMSGAAPWCEALLFAAARADHVAGVIAPALAAGRLVICDRFIDSSVAYQGVARGLGEREVRQANAVALGGVLPDLTVVLDIEPSVGLARATGSNRMEAEGLEFHRTVREAFLGFAQRGGPAYVVVDAGEPAVAVADRIEAAVRERLEDRR